MVRRNDFHEPSLSVELQTVVDRFLAPIYRVNGRIVHGTSAPALVDHLRARQWRNVSNVEARCLNLGFSIADGKLLRKNVPTRVIYRRDNEKGTG